jgi:hypothetical protein
MQVLEIANKMLRHFETPMFVLPCPCCPHMTYNEAITFWPSPKQGKLIPEYTLDLALKWFQIRFTFQGFNYKLSQKTKNLTLI